MSAIQLKGYLYFWWKYNFSLAAQTHKTDILVKIQIPDNKFVKWCNDIILCVLNRLLKFWLVDRSKINSNQFFIFFIILSILLVVSRFCLIFFVFIWILWYIEPTVVVSNNLWTIHIIICYSKNLITTLNPKLIFAIQIESSNWKFFTFSVIYCWILHKYNNTIHVD